MGQKQLPAVRTRRRRAPFRPRTGLATAAIAVAVPILLVLASAERAPAHPWYASVRAACADSATKMRCYHVRTRRRAGLSRLRLDARLRRSTSLKAARMVACSELSHYPCGDAWARPFRQAGYLPWAGSWLVGENYAWGWRTSWDAFHALMHSAPHRANILQPAFRDLGVRQRSSPWGTLWVIHFGRRW